MEPTLSVLTYNVGLIRLPVPVPGFQFAIEPNPHVMERLSQLPTAIRSIDADVVCLQEVFHPAHRTQIVMQLRDLYPYHAGDYEARSLFGVGTGLLILSRFPLSAPSFIPYAHNCFDDKLTVVRGVLWTTVTLPGGQEVAILTTHLVAGGLFRHPESRAMDEIRHEQLKSLHVIRRRIANARQIPVVVTGDFNCGPQASAGNYEVLCGEGLHDVYVRNGSDQTAVTWDPTQPLNANVLYDDYRPQRIDHVLVDEQHIQSLSARIVCTEPTIPIGSRLVPPSDHYGVHSELVLS